MPSRYLPILLANIDRTDPHHVDRLLPDQPVRDLHPIFHGCFDWHSAVHSHWSLARIGHHEVLGERITPTAVEGELTTLRSAEAFEVPYGLAWLLTLDTELHESQRTTLAPLAELARDRLLAWTTSPVDESGLHRQTAFSAWLTLRWARRNDDHGLADAIEHLAMRTWSSAADRTLLDEAGPTDFLSPALCAAALMVEVVEEPTEWLARFLPTLVDDLARTVPTEDPDPTDGHATHLDGLNLSRAWAAKRLAPYADTKEFTDQHAEAGLVASTSDHFAGSHWLPTFAVMVLTDLAMAQPGTLADHE